MIVVLLFGPAVDSSTPISSRAEFNSNVESPSRRNKPIFESASEEFVIGSKAELKISLELLLLDRIKPYSEPGFTSNSESVITALVRSPI